jgi:hypothetical protein
MAMFFHGPCPGKLLQEKIFHLPDHPLCLSLFKHSICLDFTGLFLYVNLFNEIKAWNISLKAE